MSVSLRAGGRQDETAARTYPFVFEVSSPKGWHETHLKDVTVLVAIDLNLRRKIELPKEKDRLHFLNMLLGANMAPLLVMDGLWFNCILGEDTSCLGQVIAVETEPCNGLLFRVGLMQDTVLTAKQFVEQVDCVHTMTPKNTLLMFFDWSKETYGTPHSHSTNLIDKVLTR